MKKVVICIFIMIFCLTGAAAAEEKAAFSSKDAGRCPVCGMYTARYADWHGIVEFSDSTRAVMDGPKDMFKYYLDV